MTKQMEHGRIRWNHEEVHMSKWGWVIEVRRSGWKEAIMKTSVVSRPMMWEGWVIRRKEKISPKKRIGVNRNSHTISIGCRNLTRCFCIAIRVFQKSGFINDRLSSSASSLPLIGIWETDSANTSLCILLWLDILLIYPLLSIVNYWIITIPRKDFKESVLLLFNFKLFILPLSTIQYLWRSIQRRSSAPDSHKCQLPSAY